MKNKKYELVEDNFIIHEGKKLYKIRALKEINLFGGGPKITRGALGGYVEGYHNLSQEGDCWVFYKAKVYGNARILGNAAVGGDAEVFDNARVRDDAGVYEYAKVYGNAVIKAAARVGWHANIYGNVVVRGNSEVSDDVKVYGNSEVFGSIAVGGYTKIYDNAEVYGNIEIVAGCRAFSYSLSDNSGSTHRVEGSVCGNAKVFGINNVRLILTISNKVSGNSIICHNEK